MHPQQPQNDRKSQKSSCSCYSVPVCSANLVDIGASPASSCSSSSTHDYFHLFLFPVILPLLLLLLLLLVLLERGCCWFSSLKRSHRSNVAVLLRGIVAAVSIQSCRILWLNMTFAKLRSTWKSQDNIHDESHINKRGRSHNFVKHMSTRVMISIFKCITSLLLWMLLYTKEGGLLVKAGSGRNKNISNISDLAYDETTFLWPLPKKLSSGHVTVAVDPRLSLQVQGDGGGLSIIKDAFSRYKHIIFSHDMKFAQTRTDVKREYDIDKLVITISSADETLQLGTNESYSLYIPDGAHGSIIKYATVEANTVYGALRGLETFSQLCVFNFASKTVEIAKAPWVIEDEPRFVFRGLLIDTSRHYLPLEVIKQIIESMSYAKLNVLHWHIVDEQSFPLEVPSYPNLWKGSYSTWERYTVDDAIEVVRFARSRGINVMAEIDVPGHAESWGIGYPELWPSPKCREPLDVSKKFTFEVVSGILTDLRKIFPFGLFHLGGDEVHEDCWNNTPHVKSWLDGHNMTTKDAYRYFVLEAQKIALSLGWTPVNWEETFEAFADKLSPQTIVHNWLESGVCPRVVGKGFKCLFSNQGVWYLDHLDVPWEKVYIADPIEGITDTSLQKLVIGGEVCMWGETADTSDVQQTIWPRAAAAAERLWSSNDETQNDLHVVVERLEYFRCLLNQRGIAAAPVRNEGARQPPTGPGSCFVQ